jgi:hypothetical protein
LQYYTYASAFNYVEIDASRVKRTLKEEGRGSINLAIESANNHYAAFGPGTANIFRKMIGLPKAAWYSISSNVQQYHNSKQSTISDFMT